MRQRLYFFLRLLYAEEWKRKSGKLDAQEEDLEATRHKGCFETFVENEIYFSAKEI